MKRTLLFAFVLAACYVKSQTISPVPGNTNILLHQTGEVKIGGITRGFIGNDNVIKNAQQVVIGNILEDGTIRNANNVNVGRLTDDFRVLDANNNVMGQFSSNLDISTPSQQVLGQYNERVPMIWSAVAYFFFKLN